MSGVAMGENYSHPTLEERCRLCGMMEMGLSKAEKRTMHCESTPDYHFPVY